MLMTRPSTKTAPSRSRGCIELFESDIRGWPDAVDGGPAPLRWLLPSEPPSRRHPARSLGFGFAHLLTRCCRVGSSRFPFERRLWVFEGRRPLDLPMGEGVRVVPFGRGGTRQRY